ncbi:MAG: hypothetical protein GY842_20255, partial [bacterium]|nr:hypothetical protein [bacterium]
LRGYNPIFMDPYDGAVLGKRFDAKWDPIRRSLGYARRYAQRMDLANAVPTTEIASTKYCLANPGREYLVYRPAGGDDGFTITLPAGTYAYEWFDPGVGKPMGTGQVKGFGGERRFEPPFGGDAVLLLTRKGVFPKKQWLQASPELHGIDPAKLEAAVEYLRQNSGPDGVNELV